MPTILTDLSRLCPYPDPPDVDRRPTVTFPSRAGANCDPRRCRVVDCHEDEVTEGRFGTDKSVSRVHLILIINSAKGYCSRRISHMFFFLNAPQTITTLLMSHSADLQAQLAPSHRQHAPCTLSPSLSEALAQMPNNWRRSARRQWSSVKTFETNRSAGAAKFDAQAQAPDVIRETPMHTFLIRVMKIICGVLLGTLVSHFYSYMYSI